MSGSDWNSDGSTRDRGALAEGFAAAWLAERGMRIVATNVETRVGELDIIAIDGETLVFVEVKARRRADHGPAIAAVTREKQRRVARVASVWLLTNPWKGECRFDVVGLERDGGDWKVTHIPNAFEMPSGR